MKTLNQYYDDSLNRSTVEVPDENGNETRADVSDYKYGTNAETVQGASPVDYDGSALTNAAGSSRLIQAGETNKFAHHGTAEPEMRGLYILLTLDNDGGMEVLKYAARLYRDRPHVYHSQPVQLALSVYKVRIRMHPRQLDISMYPLTILSCRPRKSATTLDFLRSCEHRQRHISFRASCSSMLNR